MSAYDNSRWNGVKYNPVGSVNTDWNQPFVKKNAITLDLKNLNRMSTTVFLAMDSYLHSPRNFFGFKKKGAIQERRPATSCVITDSGEIQHRGNFSRTKLNDDPAWRNKAVDPYEYGESASAEDILMDIAALISSEEVKELVVFDEDFPVLKGCYNKDWMNAIFEGYHKTMHFSCWLDEKLQGISDAAFEGMSAAGTLELTINQEEGQTYTAEERLQLFKSHKYCPTIHAWDMSIARSHKMYLMSQLISLLESYDYTLNSK